VGALTGILITGFGKAAVKTGTAPALTGVSGASCSLVNGLTTLSWVRPYSNGVANYTQLNATGTTRVMCVVPRVVWAAASALFCESVGCLLVACLLLVLRELLLVFVGCVRGRNQGEGGLGGHTKNPRVCVCVCFVRGMGGAGLAPGLLLHPR
jgi:hypothetical protein